MRNPRFRINSYSSSFSICVLLGSTVVDYITILEDPVWFCTSSALNELRSRLTLLEAVGFVATLTVNPRSQINPASLSERSRTLVESS